MLKYTLKFYILKYLMFKYLLINRLNNLNTTIKVYLYLLGIYYIFYKAYHLFITFYSMILISFNDELRID